MSIDYKQIAAYVKADTAIYWGEQTLYEFNEDVVPKQRPRAGKGGRMFTPTETRNFEKKIAEWGHDSGMVPVAYPIGVSLVFFDKTTDPDLRTHSLLGVTYHDKRDLDNLAKAVLDGLNKVAYKDDKQIVQLAVRRRYSMREGFRMSIGRAGLTKLEYRNLLKVLNA